MAAVMNAAGYGVDRGVVGDPHALIVPRTAIEDLDADEAVAFPVECDEPSVPGGVPPGPGLYSRIACGASPHRSMPAARVVGSDRQHAGSDPCQRAPPSGSAALTLLAVGDTYQGTAFRLM
jgi:hypothetical protein